MLEELFSDPALGRIVALSLAVSLSATAIAGVVGLPFGVALAVCRFRGRAVVVLAMNALLGLPPVVVGLALYLLLSHSGPLGFLGLLFTPAAMVVAQATLALPIITALVHRVIERCWVEFGDALRADGASGLRAMPHLIAIGGPGIVTAVLAGFGRTVSEVGAILVVGGNIAGYTRTMTTSIALQTSMGNLSLALALGAILVGISTSVSAAAFVLGGGFGARQGLGSKGVRR